jgi:hypothetical protein
LDLIGSPIQPEQHIKKNHHRVGEENNSIELKIVLVNMGCIGILLCYRKILSSDKKDQQSQIQ